MFPAALRKADGQPYSKLLQTTKCLFASHSQTENHGPFLSAPIPMPSTTPPEVVQPDQPTAALVGCLDVSNSMRNVLETERGDERAIERLRAVLRAALKLARAEQRQNPNAPIFLGAFGLDNERTSAVNLCGLIDALLDGTNSPEDKRTEHELLITLANENNVAHVTQYIRTRLTED